MYSPLQSGLQAIDGYLAANSGYPGSDVIRARCRAMLKAYATRWTADDKQYEVLSVEELVTGPIINPDTKKRSSYLAAGKIDCMLRDKKTGHILILDHKCLSSAIDDDRHEQLLIDSQPATYALLKFLNGVKVQGAIWDCLVKTTHRPKATTKNQAGETLEQFEERLLQTYLEEPNKFFLRKRIPILTDTVLEYASDLYDWTSLVDSAHKTGKSLKNPGACFEYMRPCKFLGLCSGRTDANDKSIWMQAGTNHAELELPEGTEHRQVVTNSRLKVFKTCQRKHHYQYELGLKKNAETTDEPLFVGSCVHAGLESYWKSIGGLD